MPRKGFNRSLRAVAPSLSGAEKWGVTAWSALNLVVAGMVGMWFATGLMFHYETAFHSDTALDPLPGLTKAAVRHEVGIQMLSSLFWLVFPILIFWCVNYFITMDDLRRFRRAGFWVSLIATLEMLAAVGLANLDALNSYP